MRFEKNEKNIIKDLETSITRCMHAAFNSCGYRTPEEPDFVAELVEGIPRDILKSLEVYAPGYQYAVSGIFCHQKPLACFGADKDPEIGDILIVYIEENKSGVKKCNALLLQAKKCDKIPYTISHSEEHQLKLYEEWPTFILKRAGSYNGTEIDIQPKTLNAGAQYLLFQTPYNDEKKVCCAYPDKQIMPEKRLSEQIIDLMKFFTGRTFIIKNKNKYTDDWSKLVLKLIGISGVSYFTRRASGRVKSERQTIYGEASLFDEINEQIEINDNDNDNVNDDAVSCLLIYAREKREGFQQQELILDM